MIKVTNLYDTIIDDFTNQFYTDETQAITPHAECQSACHKVEFCCQSAYGTMNQDTNTTTFLIDETHAWDTNFQNFQDNSYKVNLKKQCYWQKYCNFTVRLFGEGSERKSKKLTNNFQQIQNEKSTESN